ncbi:cilia- and flagella-associated protein 73 isoform X1 [Agelaius phoeniceus]|uniref:cilia- and flagella-associated protein 73 isoform X1 n=1 Tax=Agelaius phoeniceus TaxID=39638 RepID=UPI004054CE16
MGWFESGSPPAGSPGAFPVPRTAPSQRRSEPSQENPRELREPLAAPGNSVVLPAPRLSRPQLLGRGGGTAEMDPELAERVREAFRDKLRLLPAELHAARGRTGAARGPATLPPSTRVLLKRREAAEAERELQNQRQVRAAPAPRALQACRGDKGLAGVSPAPLRCPQAWAMLPAPCHPAGVPAADAAPGAAPAAAGPEARAAPRRRAQIRVLPQGAGPGAGAGPAGGSPLTPCPRAGGGGPAGAGAAAGGRGAGAGGGGASGERPAAAGDGAAAAAPGAPGPAPAEPPALRGLPAGRAGQDGAVPGRAGHAGAFRGAGGGAGSPGTGGRSRAGAAGPGQGTAPAVPSGEQHPAPGHQERAGPAPHTPGGCPPGCAPVGVLLDPHPEHSHPEDPAAGADQAGCAEPLPANHSTAQDPHGQSPGGYKGPAGHGAALHAGPGWHLCHWHTPTAPQECQAASGPGIAPGDTCLLLGLGWGCQGQHGATGPMELEIIPCKSGNPMSRGNMDGSGWHTGVASHPGRARALPRFPPAQSTPGRRMRRRELLLASLKVHHIKIHPAMQHSTCFFLWL